MHGYALKYTAEAIPSIRGNRDHSQQRSAKKSAWYFITRHRHTPCAMSSKTFLTSLPLPGGNTFPCQQPAGCTHMKGYLNYFWTRECVYHDNTGTGFMTCMLILCKQVRAQTALLRNVHTHGFSTGVLNSGCATFPVQGGALRQRKAPVSYPFQGYANCLEVLFPSHLEDASV